jgi:hypothetical protein
MRNRRRVILARQNVTFVIYRARRLCWMGFAEAQWASLGRKYLALTKMPDVDSSDSSSGIAVDVQQRLNCALP